VVDDPECLPGLCAGLDAQEIVCASSRYCRGLGSGSRERLARNLPSIRWEGRVHERVVGAGLKKAHVADCLVVRDLLDSRGAGTRVPWRNLKVLYHAARTSSWDITPREMSYLASESRRAMPALSARLAEDCASRSGWSAERAWACATRGRVAEDAGELRLAALWYERSLREHPGAEAALLLARALFHARQWDGVVEARERALQLEGEAQPICEGDVDARAIDVLATAALAELGRLDEAAALCRRALLNFPSSPALARLLAAIESGR
jgi:tetratricopeptide (TPR) repeat protein